MDKIKSKNKKLKVWFGRFPEEAKAYDMCVKKEAGEGGGMYYMIYINTPHDTVLPERFAELYRLDNRKIAQEHLGVRFPKVF